MSVVVAGVRSWLRDLSLRVRVFGSVGFVGGLVRRVRAFGLGCEYVSLVLCRAWAMERLRVFVWAFWSRFVSCFAVLRVSVGRRSRWSAWVSCWSVRWRAVEAVVARRVAARI